MHFLLLRRNEGLSLFLLFVDIIYGFNASPGFLYIFGVFLEMRGEVCLFKVLKKS